MIAGSSDWKSSIRKITEGPGHYFYGYYDNASWSGNDKFHLCHRVEFMERIPTQNDVALLGMVDIESREFTPIAKTTAWNFQQASMLQWSPQSPDHLILFNTYENGVYQGVIMDIHTPHKRFLDRPIANVDPSGKFALSINFQRMFDFRAGYGYAGIVDPGSNKNHPQDDGVFLIDLQTGRSRLILSFEQIYHLTKDAFPWADQKILINHINFNTDGSRFVILVRNFPSKSGGWKTAVVTVNTDGTDPYLLLDTGMASHYHWKDPEHLVIYCKAALLGVSRIELYILKDRSHEVCALDTNFFTSDGHCSYSPDRNWMLYDSYPDHTNYRHLYLYNLEKNQGERIGSFYSPPHITGDFRCDLHPRWNRAGTKVSIDSIHEGQRHIYVIDVLAGNKKMRGRV